MGVILSANNQYKLQKTLDSEDYTLYKQYSLENTIVNTSNVYNTIVRPDHNIVFGIDVARPALCPSFNLCHKEQRPNRVVTTGPVAFNPHVSMRTTYVNSYTNSYTKNQASTATNALLKRGGVKKLACRGSCKKVPGKPLENAYFGLCITPCAKN